MPATQPVGGAGAKRPQHLDVNVHRPDLARDCLGRDRQRHERGDRAERPERDRFGSDGALHLRVRDGRDPEVGDLALWDQTEQRMLDGRDVAVAMDQLHGVPGPLVGARGEHRSRQGRRVEHVGRSLIDVVLDDLVVELDDAHKRDVDAPHRGNARGSEGGLRELIGAVQADLDDLADVRPEQVCSERGRDHLVLAGGIGHAPLDRCRPVHVEEQPVDASYRIQARIEVGGAVGPQRGDAGADPALHMPHLWEVSDRGGQRGRVARRPRTGPVHRHGQRRWIGARDKGRERRLGTPARRDRRHRDTAE